MSLSQTLTRRRDADLLQRALDGDRDALDHPLLRDESGELAALLRLSSELPRPRVAPDRAFVARLRDQLVAEAEHRPLLSSVDERTAEVSRTPAPAGPRMLTVPRGGRLLAGLAAAVVLVAAVLGGLSTRALPGDTLYPVKLMIGDAQVRLAGSDIGRGKALLALVDTRLDEVDGLVAAGNPPPSLVDDTLTRASDDLGDAQRELLTTGSGRPDPRAIQLLADAGAQATGRLAALRDRVPLASVPAVDQLLQQLAQARSAMLQQLDRLAASGSCGDVCDSVRATLEQQGTELTRLLGGVLGSAGQTSPAPGQVAGQAGSDRPPRSSGGVLAGTGGIVPTSAPSGGAGGGSVTLPGVSLPGVTVPGASVGGDGGGLAASLPGATVSVPGASVGVPSVGVTVPTTSTTGLPLPGVTVGGTTPTLGPVTIPVPTIGVGGDCVTLICLGG
jgi:hypothetical protein